MMDRMTGRPRGFAFVSMSTPEEAQRAIDGMNGTSFGGRNITVNIARPKEERSPDGPRGGGLASRGYRGQHAVDRCPAVLGRDECGRAGPVRSARRNHCEGGGSMGLTAIDERPVVFDCQGQELLGIVARPASGHAHRVGVVVVVGGPQYRAGSHRHFTLMCRQLASRGVATLRFDYRGSGDSAGPPLLGVEGAEADIRAATDALMSAVPELGGVALWGLCGAASASALYAPEDERVRGLVMLNPWVRTEEGLAKTRLRHYYLERLVNRDFWHRMARGEVAVTSSLRALGGNLRSAIGLGSRSAAGAEERAREGRQLHRADSTGTLPERMLDSLEHSSVPVLVILSGESDLTANEFRGLVGSSAGWQRWLAHSQVQRHDIAQSNHTFARADWRDKVTALTARWVLEH